MRKGFQLLTVVLLLGTLVSSARSPRVDARGEDVCPEPNDTFQTACYLSRGSPIPVGFISHPGDTDAYRFEVVDFDKHWGADLSNAPFPYRLEIADWNGRVIGSATAGEHLAVQLGPPGIYYLFVDSPGGQFSDSQPYRIVRRLLYPAEIPILLMAAEWRGSPGEVFSDTGTTTHSDDLGDYSIAGGKITLKMKVADTDDEPMAASFHLPPEPPDPGPIVTDFSMTLDARVENSPKAGYEVLFRWVNDDNYYSVAVDTGAKEVTLYKVVNGERADLSDWTPVPGLKGAQVYRTTIRCVGQEIRVYVNNIGVIRWTDDSFSKGLVGFGAITWGPPPTVTIDNILVTTPTYR